ncbi:MAG: flagellar filament capping protein FliD [Deltaproteobacteria bacterium]|nr:flagellar filament capping protein FliD [Deltaproteobacteria bacterium]
MTGSISTLGVGSGLKLQNILDQLKAVDKQPIDRKNTEITGLNTQINEFTTINNKLLTMKSSALDLYMSGTYLGRTVASSDTTVVSATVLDGAAAKTYSVQTTNLAKQSLFMSSSGFATKDSSVATVAGSMTIELGNSTTNFQVNVAANSTLSQLVDSINNDTTNPGVTASIINDGLNATTPYKLVLKSNGLGENNRIQILQQLPGASLTEDSSQTAANSLNSQFTVDGVSYQRQSNSVDDVVDGVTLTLKSAGSASITVSADNAGLQDKITSLVTSYNDVVQEIGSKTSYDQNTKKFGILAHTTMRDLPTDLESLMTSSNSADSTGTIKNLFDLGMAFNRDGTITIDSATLSTAISTNSDKVKSFFLGDSTKGIVGFADKVNSRLRTMTGNAGVIAGEKTAAQSRIGSLQDQISSDTARLNKKYALLTKQFVALDTFMSQETSLSDFLTGQFNSINGTSTKNG